MERVRGGEGGGGKGQGWRKEGVDGGRRRLEEGGYSGGREGDESTEGRKTGCMQGRRGMEGEQEKWCMDERRGDTWRDRERQEGRE